MIAVVNYGLGNVGSIANILKRIGAEAAITSDPSQIRQAEKLVLPGVGSFDAGMEKLQASGLRPILEDQVLVKKTPLLAICLGMQMLTSSSEEGAMKGLGWLDARTVKFALTPDQPQLRIPHMGWNTVTAAKKSNLFPSIDNELRFYFVHSYHVVCNQPGDILLRARYGIDFVAAVQKGNIMGVQFHPERSHIFGMNLMRRFAEGSFFD